MTRGRLRYTRHSRWRFRVAVYTVAILASVLVGIAASVRP